MLAGYAKVALASILDPSGGLFSDAARPSRRPAPPFGANVALENPGVAWKQLQAHASIFALD